MKPLDDDQLDAMLNAWQTRPAPGSLNTKMLDAYRRTQSHTSIWKWLLTGNLRVPTPALAGLLVVVFGLFIFSWRGTHAVTPQPQTRVVIETRTVEVPVVQERVVVRTVYRDRTADSGFQFVTAIRPEIIRSSYVDR
jgi:hypothetical protein